MANIIYMTDFSEAYARGILLGIAKYAHDIGEAWSICRLPLSIRDQYGIRGVINYAVRHHVDAVIGQFNPSDNVSKFRQKGILAIAQDFKVSFSGVANIKGEYARSGEMAASYFMAKGYKSFAFYGVKNVVWSEDRRSGFVSTIATRLKDFSFSVLEMPVADMWQYDLDATTEWLRKLPKPVAILACDDTHAYYLSEACRLMQSGEGGPGARLSIPDDIAVLGIDNDETICKMSSVSLSSISQDTERGGYEVARYIDEALKNPDTPVRDIIVPVTNVVTRASTDMFVNDDPAIARVIKYIHENIDKRLSVDDIVAQVPLSRRLLEERFKKVMETSIYNYLIRIRVDKIAQLIADGMSISDAAFELGFSDVKNLSRLFKKFIGMTPSEFKSKTGV